MRCTRLPSSPAARDEAAGLFSAQRTLPGIPVADRRLQELAKAQREFMEAFDRYERLRLQLFVQDPLPSLLRRQAS